MSRNLKEEIDQKILSHTVLPGFFYSCEDSRADSSASSTDNKNQIETIIGDEDDIEYSSSDDDEDKDDEEEDDEEKTTTVSDADSVDDQERLNESFDDENETPSDNNTPLTSDMLENTYNLVHRARDFIRMTRRTYFIRDYFKQEALAKKLPGEGLILDCTIRWNSSFYMIQRFVKYQDVINEITSNPRMISPKISQQLTYRLKSSNFSHEEWNVLTAVQNVLVKFEEASQLISGRKYQTLSLGYLILVGLERHLSQPKGTEQLAEIEFSLRQSLYDAFRYHIKNKVNFTQRKSMLVSEVYPNIISNGQSSLLDNRYLDSVFEEMGTIDEKK